MVQLCARISRSASIRRRQYQQAQCERTQGQKRRFLLSGESFKMPHGAGFRRSRIGRIDYYEIRPKVRLELGCGLRVRHHDHALTQSRAGAEFLTACFGEPGADHTQDDLRLIELLAGFRVHERRDALTGPGWGHIHGETVYSAQRLKTKSRDLIPGVAVGNEYLHVVPHFRF